MPAALSRSGSRALSGGAVEVPVDRFHQVAGRDRRPAVPGPRRSRQGRAAKPCESVISAQPTSPSSVVAFRKIQGRQPASQVSVSSEAIFTSPEDTQARPTARARTVADAA